MTQDPVILGYLGRALSFEFSAVQQYLSLARMLSLRGLPQAGDKFRLEAQEEMEHAERIIGRMLAVGVAPSASILRPARLDGSLSELIQHTVKLETEIVNFYAQAVQYCQHAQDHENRIFFEALLTEEQQHAAGLQEWWQEIAGEQLPTVK
ncbi:MAG: hypothetical protein COB33_005730 [Thiotrichaceae bacterium]|nr:hypothetical protein [Thiotrichaceae bacterium]